MGCHDWVATSATEVSGAQGDRPQGEALVVSKAEAACAALRRHRRGTEVHVRCSWKADSLVEAPFAAKSPLLAIATGPVLKRLWVLARESRF